MKNKPFTICGETIQPGESASLAMPLPELFSCAPMYMPIKVINGKNLGPVLLVMAAMHGNELNGTEIINQLLRSSQLKKLKGTLICIPILNVQGFINKTRTLPGGISLNENFPGSPDGSHTERTAHLISSEILSLADYCIDLQTGFLNYSNLPHIYIGRHSLKERALAEAFSAPAISKIDAQPGSLRATAEQEGIPCLTYEAGEAMRFDEDAIKVGLKGVLSILREIEMLTAKTPPKTNLSFMMEDSEWVRSPTSGINHSKIQLGQEISKGEILSSIRDPFGSGIDVKVKAPSEGIIVAVNNLPLVHEGSELYQIAYFKKHDQAVSHFEDWETDEHEKEHKAGE
mgnify:CR=1 FL=1